MKLIIKNMAGSRHMLHVKKQLDNHNIKYSYIEQGEIGIIGKLTHQKQQALRLSLKIAGLDIVGDKKLNLVEKLIKTIRQMVHDSENLPTENYSVYLSSKLNHNYTYLANVFSEIEGITIEHFIINNKIEKVKELIIHNVLNLTEIAAKLNYSSVAHLSNQFKKVTGMTPSYFKNKIRRRKDVSPIAT